MVRMRAVMIILIKKQTIQKKTQRAMFIENLNELEKYHYYGLWTGQETSLRNMSFSLDPSAILVPSHLRNAGSFPE